MKLPSLAIRESLTRKNSDASAADSRRQRKLALFRRAGLFGGNMLGAIIERATSFEDLRAAYALVHTTFVHSGYIHEHQSGIRLRINEANPDMATFVAKVGSNVVGTISILPDSTELGLPSDSAFKNELNELRASGARLCEVTNQSVAVQFRKSAIATELIRCAMAHVLATGFDETIAAVSPSHQGFYEVLNFRQVGTQRSYSGKIHDPVVALSMNVEQYRDLESNLDETAQFVHDFMARMNPFRDCVQLWILQARECFNNPKQLRKLFVTNTGLISKCSALELKMLRHWWGESTFEIVTKTRFRRKRVQIRTGSTALAGPPDQSQSEHPRKPAQAAVVTVRVVDRVHHAKPMHY